MKKNYFVIICTIIFLIMISMVGFLSYKLIEQSNNNIINENINDNAAINNDIKKFNLVNTIIGEKTIKKPIFYNKTLDDYIDNFININNCDTFTFNINYLNNDLVNINLKCQDTIENKIFNLKNSTFQEFKELIKDEITFKSKVYNLLNLKYPKFVSDEVDILNSKYIIKDNQVELTYETIDYGTITLKINNNEIKDLLNYNMKYDKKYENEIYTLDPNKKTIAFTFDDGPSTYDIEIVNALKESHATATFFIVGSRIDNYQKSIKYIIDNNMEVGNHSYDHKSFKKISNDDILYQIIETNKIYKEFTNKEINLLRPPYGAFKENIHVLSNMPIILWNVDTLDWQVRNTEKIYKNIIDVVKDGDIVLMHSLFEPTKDAVIKVLPELYKRGYQVVSVSELARLKGINIEPGNVYRSF